MFDKIYKEENNFVTKGSGWSLYSIDALQLRINIVNPLTGSTYDYYVWIDDILFWNVLLKVFQIPQDLVRLINLHSHSINQPYHFQRHSQYKTIFRPRRCPECIVLLSGNNVKNSILEFDILLLEFDCLLLIKDIEPLLPVTLEFYK
ncbi:Uncharacterized protein FWK35_00002799 [Aphis craccivora]|uniref:Uncharacterized protein n=1 Tax=Aphis craccivora TaxID=307492 RepID=A0A6G0YWZ3_APHCR|nr:Uncharacterized protein FWK35_00002799 [Aphis craccivora]